MAERVDFFTERDGSWRWRYSDPDAGVELLSNTTYSDEQDARRAAFAAYPALAVEMPSAPEQAPPRSGPDVRRALLAGGVCLLIALLLLWLRGRRR